MTGAGTEPVIPMHEKGYVIARHKFRIGQREFVLPRSKWLRILLGAGFLLGGLLAILPVFGLWMIPVGLFVLSIDLPPVRRLRRRTVTWCGRSRLRPGFERLWQRLRDAGKKKGPSG